MLAGVALAFLMAAFILLLLFYGQAYIYLLIYSKSLLMQSPIVQQIQPFAFFDPARNNLVWFSLRWKVWAELIVQTKCAAPSGVQGGQEGRGGRWKGLGREWGVEGEWRGESMGRRVEQSERWILWLTVIKTSYVTKGLYTSPSRVTWEVE